MAAKDEGKDAFDRAVDALDEAAIDRAKTRVDDTIALWTEEEYAQVDAQTGTVRDALEKWLSNLDDELFKELQFALGGWDCMVKHLKGPRAADGDDGEEDCFVRTCGMALINLVAARKMEALRALLGAMKGGCLAGFLPAAAPFGLVYESD